LKKALQSGGLPASTVVNCCWSVLISALTGANAAMTIDGVNPVDAD
jgi:hypothetical protein